MLYGSDSGPQSVFDPFGPVRVRGHLAMEHASRIDDGFHFFESELLT